VVPVHWVSGQRCKQIGMLETKRDCGGRITRHAIGAFCGPPICFSSGPKPSGRSSVEDLRVWALSPGNHCTCHVSGLEGSHRNLDGIGTGGFPGASTGRCHSSNYAMHRSPSSCPDNGSGSPAADHAATGSPALSPERLWGGGSISRNCRQLPVQNS